MVCLLREDEGPGTRRWDEYTRESSGPGDAVSVCGHFSIAWNDFVHGITRVRSDGSIPGLSGTGDPTRSLLAMWETLCYV